MGCFGTNPDAQPFAQRIFHKVFPKIFFGNAVFVGCVFILLAETPGQSFFLGLYTERFIEDFGMSRSNASSLFALAFFCSAVVVQVMGKVLDRCGPRKMIMFAALPYLSGMLLTSTANGPIPLAAGFVLTRILGPDGIAFAAKVTISRWFRRLRGRAVAISSLTIAVEILVCGGFNILSDAIGWRTSTIIAAAICMCLLTSGVQLVFDSPEALGLLPDGDSPANGTKSADGEQPDAECNRPAVHENRQSQQQQDGEEVTFTRAEAIRTVPFWVFIFLCFIVCVGWGGLNVHMKNVCASHGLPPETISSIYSAIGICAPLGSLSLGCALDYARTVRGKMRVCTAVPVMSAVSLLLAVWLDSAVAAAVFGVATGLFVGFFVVMMGSIFACLFGRQHLGSIMAVPAGFGLCGTAIGPLVLGGFREATGSYTVPLLALSAAVLVNAAAIVACHPPRPLGSGRGGGGSGGGGVGSPDEGQLGLRERDALSEA